MAKHTHSQKSAIGASHFEAVRKPDSGNDSDSKYK